MNVTTKLYRCLTLALAGLACAAGLMFTQVASAQIATTKHNLGSTGPGPNKFGGTDELCVFCHTPHGADTSAAAPLWNRVISGTTYQTYDSLGTSTLDGKTAPVGSVSIACMSCHDGTQAMNVVINAPGSGGYNALAAACRLTGGNQTGGQISVDRYQPYHRLEKRSSNRHSVRRWRLQQHDTDHACRRGRRSGLRPSAKRSAGFQSRLVGRYDGARWACGITPEDRYGTLYARPGCGRGGYTGQTEPEPFVECASCHDPHSANPTFLRIPEYWQRGVPCMPREMNAWVYLCDQWVDRVQSRATGELLPGSKRHQGLRWRRLWRLSEYGTCCWCTRFSRWCIWPWDFRQQRLRLLLMPGSVIAQVGDVSIKREEFEQALGLEARRKFYHGKTPEAEMAALQREVARKMVDDILLTKEAIRRGLKPDAEPIKRTIAEYETRYRSSEQWQVRRVTLLPKIQKQLETDSLLQQLRQKVQNVSQPDTAELQDYYNSNLEKFTEPERSRVSTILLKVDPLLPGRRGTKHDWKRPAW